MQPNPNFRQMSSESMQKMQEIDYKYELLKWEFIQKHPPFNHGELLSLTNTVPTQHIVQFHLHV